MMSFLALMVWTAWAVPSPDLSVVLKEGLAFSPEVKKAEAGLREAEDAKSQKQRLLFPTIDAVGKGSNKKTASGLSGSGSIATSNEEFDAYFQLKQPLYKGGALLNGVRSYKAAEDIARQKFFEARQKASYDLILAYLKLSESERKLRAAEEHQQILKSYSEIVSRHEKIGRSRRIEALQAAVNIALIDAEVVKLKSERDQSSDNLKRLLGRPEGGDAIEGNVAIPLPKVAPVPLAQAMEALSLQNPELQVAQLEREKREHDNALENAEDRPELSLDGTWGYKSPDRPSWFEESSRYYTVGLTLRVPLFSGFSSLAKRRVHAERMQQSERSVESKRLELRQRLEAAIVTMMSESSRLSMADAASKQAREALNLSNSGYRQGIANHQDVLNAQNTRYNSEKLLIETKFSYLRSIAEVRWLMGTNLEQVYAK